MVQDVLKRMMEEERREDAAWEVEHRRRMRELMAMDREDVRRQRKWWLWR